MWCQVSVKTCVGVSLSQVSVKTCVGVSLSSIVVNYSASKIVQLVYKFLHTGCPKSFAPCISSYSSSYSTRHSQSDGNFLVVP